MIRHWKSRSIFSIILALALAGGCARVAIEGGEKPIKVDVTVTHKVDRELDEFFAFEKKYQPGSTTQPASTQPADSGGTP